MKQLLSPSEIVTSGLCIGCGSCVAQRLFNAQMEFNEFGHLVPTAPDASMSTPSLPFTRTCPFSAGADNEDTLARKFLGNTAYHSSELGHYRAAFVGHVAEGEFRAQGSSGGMVSWVASELLRQGLVDAVVHVATTDGTEQDERFFSYRISRSENEISGGAKSRYYPVEMADVLSTIRTTEGRYAIVGVPCFIKAVQLLRQEDGVVEERIRFTLGLFCGHMKSAHFVESIALQQGTSLPEVKGIDYRRKEPSRPANIYTASLALADGQIVNRDWWNLVDGDWGAGFFMNSACNFCDDVVAETADLSFGDAWIEPFSSDGRGTNVVVVRSKFMENLIRSAIVQGRLALTEVDDAFVVQTQAAGFRHRREGLAYRLTWARSRHLVRKRVSPSSTWLPLHRKVLYRTRYYISSWSNWIFHVTRRFKKPGLYLAWARLVAAFYHSLAYHNGKISEMRKRLEQLKNV